MLRLKFPKCKRKVHRRRGYCPRENGARRADTAGDRTYVARRVEMPIGFGGMVAGA